MSAVQKTENANKVIIFMMDKKKNSLINQFVETIDAKGEIEYKFTTSANEVVQYLNQLPQALLLFEILDRESLAQVMSVMKLSEKLIKASHVKVAGFNRIKNDNIEKALKKMGCNDILTQDIKIKTFSFKIDFWFKTLKSKFPEVSTDNIQKISSNNKKLSETSSASENKAGLQMVAAIQEENDVWILKHRNDCKNVLRRWLIKLMGPSPQVAKWESVSIQVATGQKQLWRFDYKSGEEDSFSNGKGAWFYDGSRPEFDWKENVWIFSGPMPALFHSHEGHVEYRFKSDDKAILFAENSIFAETKKQLIIESFNREYEFKNEETSQQEEAQSFEGVELGSPDVASHHGSGEKINGRMVGKGETQKLNDEDLSGEGSAADKIESLLKGKTSKADQIDGQMSGKAGATDVLDGNLSGTIGPSSKTNKNEDPFEGQVDQLDKYYRGDDGSTSRPNNEPKNTKRNGFKEDLGGALSGQLSPEAKKAKKDDHGNFAADELDKYYNGETSNQKSTADDKNANEQDVDKIEEYLKGKNVNQDDNEKEKSARNAPIAKKTKTAADDNILPFNKKKTEPSDANSSQNIDNFSQVYRDDLDSDQDIDENGQYLKKEKVTPRYERDDTIDLDNLDQMSQADYERITASGEVKIILEKINQAQVKVIGQFQDLFDSELIVSVKDFSIAVNEKFKVYVMLKYLNQNVKLAIDCIVTLVEEQEDGESYVTFDVQDFSREKLDHFMEVYNQRQSNIGEFLNKVKGNE